MALCLTTSAALAQPPPASGAAPADGAPAGVAPAATVYRLTPAEIEAALADAAARNARQMPLLPPLPAAGPALAAADRRPHGEVGMMVGSGGARAMWGSTVVPLGQDGVAAFSFQAGRWPRLPY